MNKEREIDRGRKRSGEKAGGMMSQIDGVSARGLFNLGPARGWTGLDPLSRTSPKYMFKSRYIYIDV